MRFLLDEIATVIAELPSEAADVATKMLTESRKALIFNSYFYPSSGKIIGVRSFEKSVHENLKKALGDAMPAAEEGEAPSDAENFALGMRSKLLIALWKEIPAFVLFREEDSFLPDLMPATLDRLSAWLNWMAV